MKTKGSRAALPIKKKEDIRKISEYFTKNKNTRDYCMFIIGINTALRGCDIRHLKVKHLKNGIDKNSDFSFKILEQKTKKPRTVICNDAVQRAIKWHLNETSFECDDSYAFTSKRFKNKPLSREFFTKMLSYTFKVAANLDSRYLNGSYSSHSLRKTFGYHAYQSGVSLPILMKIFNHSSQLMTLQYIGLTDKDVVNVHEKIVLS